MVVVSYSGKEINAKLVYYGPGLSGKTTNLENIYSNVPNTNRGKMVSMKTRTERTLFFDFLPIDLGDIGGFKTRFLLYTVPGQVYYNATRKLVLRGVDAIIFVADSARDKMAENIESLQNLHDNLSEYGLNLDEIPFVIQYNKRDLPDVYSVEELEKALNPKGVPCYEVVATTGQGVFESFRGIARLLMQKLGTEIKFGDSKKTSRSQAKAPESPVSIAPPTPASPVSIDLPTPVSVEPSTPEPPRPATPPTAPAGDGVPYRPASRGPSNREAPVAERPAASPPPAMPSQPTAPTGDGSILSSSAEFVSPPQAPATASTSAPEEAEEPESLVSAAGEWDEAQAAAEEAALEAEISKRSADLRQKLADEHGEDEFGEVPVKKPGFWGRMFGRKPKAPLIPPLELPDEGFEPSAYEDSESDFLSEGTPETALAPEPPTPPPVESYDGDEADSSEFAVTPLDAARDATAENTSVDASEVIERRVDVPVILTADEIAQGAKLRLVMEIKVQAPAKSDGTKVA